MNKRGPTPAAAPAAPAPRGKKRRLVRAPAAKNSTAAGEDKDPINDAGKSTPPPQVSVSPEIASESKKKRLKCSLSSSSSSDFVYGSPVPLLGLPVDRVGDARRKKPRAILTTLDSPACLPLPLTPTRASVHWLSSDEVPSPKRASSGENEKIEAEMKLKSDSYSSKRSSSEHEKHEGEI